MKEYDNAQAELRAKICDILNSNDDIIELVCEATAKVMTEADSDLPYESVQPYFQ